MRGAEKEAVASSSFSSFCPRSGETEEEELGPSSLPLARCESRLLQCWLEDSSALESKDLETALEGWFPEKEDEAFVATRYAGEEEACSDEETKRACGNGGGGRAGEEREAEEKEVQGAREAGEGSGQRRWPDCSDGEKAGQGTDGEEGTRDGGKGGGEEREFNEEFLRVMASPGRCDEGVEEKKREEQREGDGRGGDMTPRA